MNYMLIADGVVVSQAKTPLALNYNILGCHCWSVCLKATDVPDDSGIYGCVAIVDWGTGKCHIIVADGIGCELPVSYCEGFNNIIALVRSRLQTYHNDNKFNNYIDLPAIRVIPA